MNINKEAIKEHKWNMDQCKYSTEKIYLVFMNHDGLNRYSANEAYYYHLIPEENRTDDIDEATIILYMSWGISHYKRYSISYPYSNKVEHVIPAYTVSCDLTVLNSCGAYKGTKAEKYEMYSGRIWGNNPELKETSSHKISKSTAPKKILGTFNERLLYQKLEWILEQFDITINEQGYPNSGSHAEEPEFFIEDLYYQVLQKGDAIKDKYSPEIEAQGEKGGCKKGCLWGLVIMAGLILIPMLLNVIYQFNETIGKILVWGVLLSIVPLIVYFINFKKMEDTIPITSKEEFIKDLKRKFPYPDSGYPMYDAAKEFWINTEIVTDSLATIQFQDRKPTEVHIEQNKITIHETVGNQYQSQIFGNFKSVKSIKKHKSFMEYLNKIARFKNSPESKGAVELFTRILGGAITSYYGVEPIIDWDKLPFLYRHSETSLTYLLMACFANYSRKYAEFYSLMQAALIENRYDHLLENAQVESIKIHMKEIKKHLIKDTMLDYEYMNRIRP